MHWGAKLSLDEGVLRRVDTCFSGQAVVAPDAEMDAEDDLPHEVIEQDDRTCTWRSVTTGNRTMRHASTQALSLEIEAPLRARLTVEVNSQRYVHTLEELLVGASCHYLRGWLSEAVRIGPLTSLSACTVEAEFNDPPERETDRYRLRAAQKNGHWVWLTPIWVSR